MRSWTILFVMVAQKSRSTHFGFRFGVQVTLSCVMCLVVFWRASAARRIESLEIWFFRNIFGMSKRFFETTWNARKNFGFNSNFDLIQIWNGQKRTCQPTERLNGHGGRNVHQPPGINVIKPMLPYSFRLVWSTKPEICVASDPMEKG